MSLYRGVNATPLYQIIQGGMGVGVSGWRLARSVSSAGQLGVVSGTALDVLLSRQLQQGDSGGHLRRAMAAFPVEEISRRVTERYFIEGGKKAMEPFIGLPMASASMVRDLEEINVLAGFVYVYLAREGHQFPVGINLLEKIQMPTLALLYGAMLAGVDVVLMGAGIPVQIPGILDRYASAEAASLRITAPGEPHYITFDPKRYGRKAGGGAQAWKRPDFIGIVSSVTLARHLLQKSSGTVNGFVVEEPVAGGHNAPPRGKMNLSESGEPVYTERDRVDLEAFRKLKVPFWLAGGYGREGRLKEALKQGAAGIQVGTLFAFCEESGILPELKEAVIREAVAGRLKIFTDSRASPTGFPFKVVKWKGSAIDPEVYGRRNRVCDLGFLRQAARDESGKLIFRCPSEPEVLFRKKGGNSEDLAGRVCLCNGLLSTIGVGQIRGGEVEPPLLTAGDDLAILPEILKGRSFYSAGDALKILMSD